MVVTYPEKVCGLEASSYGTSKWPFRVHKSSKAKELGHCALQTSAGGLSSGVRMDVDCSTGAETWPGTLVEPRRCHRMESRAQD